jgi:hypothetical protein
LNSDESSLPFWFGPSRAIAADDTANLWRAGRATARTAATADRGQEISEIRTGIAVAGLTIGEAGSRCSNLPSARWRRNRPRYFENIGFGGTVHGRV